LLEDIYRSFVINVIVDDGDAVGILESVIESGGIGQSPNDIYYYIPWLCAVVKISDA
jgi:hypothetical protein